jgi:hypothetical protein
MRLELNGVLVSDQPDEATFAHALKQMARKDDVLTLLRPPADIIQATGSAARGFALNIYDDARGTNLVSANPALKMATVVAIFVRFLHGEKWDGDIPWRSGAEKQRKSQRRLPGLAGLIALAIFGAAYLAAGVGMWQTQPPGFTWRDYGLGCIGIAVLAFYIGWLDIFFSILRPRLGDWIGGIFGIHVQESLNILDAGIWNVSGGTMGQRLLVHAIGIVILLIGVMIPIAVPAMMAFLLFAR